jgi:hypothetical protein
VMSFKLFVRVPVFLMLNVFGKATYCSSFCMMHIMSSYMTIVPIYYQSYSYINFDIL